MPYQVPCYYKHHTRFHKYALIIKSNTHNQFRDEEQNNITLTEAGHQSKLTERIIALHIQWNLSCEATPFVPQKEWPLVRGRNHYIYV